MRDIIFESVCKAWNDAVTDANAEIRLIVKQAKLAKDFTEFIKSKLIGTIEYGDSDFGKAYIKARFPEYGSDDELRNAMATFYDGLTDKQEEILSKRGLSFSERDLKSIGMEARADACIFIKRHTLAQYLKRLSDPLNRVSKEFKDLFRNDFEMAKFYAEAKIPKPGKNRVTGTEIANSFPKYSQYKNPTLGGVSMSFFVEELQKLGVNLGYDAIYFGFFPEKRGKK